MPTNRPTKVGGAETKSQGAVLTSSQTEPDILVSSLMGRDMDLARFTTQVDKKLKESGGRTNLKEEQFR